MSQDLEQQEGEYSFQELLATILLNDELSILLPESEVKRTRQGIVRCKSEQNSMLAANGLPKDSSRLTFEEIPQEDGMVLLKVLVTKGSTVRAKIILPDNSLT